MMDAVRVGHPIYSLGVVKVYGLLYAYSMLARTEVFKLRPLAYCQPMFLDSVISLAHVCTVTVS